MADYFRVDTQWSVQQCKAGVAINIVITGEVVFFYSTWLKGSIESNTYAKLADVFSSWRDKATQHVQSLNLNVEKVLLAFF